MFILTLLSLIIWTINKIFNKNIKKYIKKYWILKNFIELCPVLLIIFILRSFIYEPFQIPSSSMLPTLWIGDLILVNKTKYNIKNPWNNKTILNIKNPEYGDIIVFQYPYNKNINYIKRVVGLPKDKIIYDENKKEIKIYKYCKKIKKYKKKNLVKYSKKKISSLVEEIKFDNNHINEYILNIKNQNLNINKNSNIIFFIKKKEYIKKHNNNILTIYGFKKNNIKKTWIIPENMYFVMGDNRDNSKDSRTWGFVDKNLIIGKAEYIWMSLDKQQNSLPKGIRFNRIGIIK